jgi:hypothetical protein
VVFACDYIVWNDLQRRLATEFGCVLRVKVIAESQTGRGWNE